MRPRALVIEVVRRYHFISETQMKKLKRVFYLGAFKNE
jgi:hypothetical protein